MLCLDGIYLHYSCDNVNTAAMNYLKILQIRMWSCNHVQRTQRAGNSKRTLLNLFVIKKC